MKLLQRMGIAVLALLPIACGADTTLDIRELCEDYNPPEHDPVKLYAGMVEIGSDRADVGLAITSRTAETMIGNQAIVVFFLYKYTNTQTGEEHPSCRIAGGQFELDKSTNKRTILEIGYRAGERQQYITQEFKFSEGGDEATYFHETAQVTIPLKLQ